jgi:hypothetical protein
MRWGKTSSNVSPIVISSKTETGQTAGLSVDVARWKACGHAATIIPAGATAVAANSLAARPNRQVQALLFAGFAGDMSIVCQYVGTLPTAKGYGSLPLYALHQKV